MGTRNLVVVVFKGHRVVVQFGANDGNPAETGKRLLHYLNSPEFVEKLKTGLTHTYKVDGITAAELREKCETEYTFWGMVEFVKKFKKAALEKEKPGNVTDLSGRCLHTASLHTWIGPDVLALVANATEENPVPLEFEEEFNWQWVYVVDLDSNVLEVFSGLEEKKEGHRFVDSCSGFVPKFIISVPFSKIGWHNQAEHVGEAFEAFVYNAAQRI